MKSITLRKSEIEQMQILGDIFCKDTVVTTVKNKLDKLSKQVNTITTGFSKKHPRIFFFSSLIAMPIAIMGVVFAGTFTVMFPISTLLGWI